jgi:uncharacterized phage protein gp47/JayE
MPWLVPALRERRRQVRDLIAAYLPGADAAVPNSVLRVVGDVQAALTHDNDQHLGWLARMMMPDTAEGPFAERWANIWLADGRKGATPAAGAIAVTGALGAVVPVDTLLNAVAYDAAGQSQRLTYKVLVGVTLATSPSIVQVAALTAGALGNLETGQQIAFETVPAGIDGQATVAAPGLAGGADQESDADLVARYIDVIQNPPHGGTTNDYVQWAKAVPGVTRAWARQEMGAGTMTVRIMLDVARAAFGGLPQPADLTAVAAHLDTVRPVTVAELYVLAPIAVPLNLTITDLANDTPAVRTAIGAELAAMLAARAAPGQTIYASWVREAISAATGEDHHDIAVGNVVPASAGHMVVPGTVTYT